MKKLLLVSALMCAILGVAASGGNASARLLVAGAGASPVSGHVVLNARASGPLVGTLSPVAPAVGFLRAPEVIPVFGPSNLTGTRDLSGTVTCIGLLPGQPAVAVSGDLDTPVVSQFGIFTNFTVLLSGFEPAGLGSIQVWINELLPFSHCGTDLFFAAGQELPEVVAVSRVVKGHFAINGIG